MAPSAVKRLRNQVGWTGAPWSWRSVPLTRDTAPQWIAVGAAGVAVGLFTAQIATSQSRGGSLLLLAALAPFVLMMARNVRRLLLAIVVFDIPFQWDKNFHYDAAAANLGALGGLNISVTTIALAGLYGMWGAELLARRAEVVKGTMRAALPLIVYLGFTAASAFVAGNKELSLFEVAMLVQSLLVFIYVAGTVRTRDDVQFVVVALVGSLLFEGLVTLAIGVTGAIHLVGIHTYSDPGISSASESGYRFGGTIGSPNTAASYFSLLVAPCIALATTPVSRRLRRFAIAAAGLGAISLVLTYSRGGWIALFVSCVFLMTMGLRRGWISPRIPVAAAIGLTVLILPFSGQIATRIGGSDQGSAASRIPLIRLASNVIEDHPVLGVGANNLGLVIPTYAGPEYDGYWIYTVHNKYLLVWAEAGIGALAAFLWFLLSTLRTGWRVWRDADPFLGPIALGLTAGVIGQMVHMGVDIFQSRPQVQLLWLVAGLLVAMRGVAGEAAA